MRLKELHIISQHNIGDMLGVLHGQVNSRHDGQGIIMSAKESPGTMDLVAMGVATPAIRMDLGNLCHIIAVFSSWVIPDIPHIVGCFLYCSMLGWGYGAT